ncbi:UPF0235 protein C15orf40 homolog [Aulostomus maculatus]
MFSRLALTSRCIGVSFGPFGVVTSHRVCNWIPVPRLCRSTLPTGPPTPPAGHWIIRLSWIAGMPRKKVKGQLATSDGAAAAAVASDPVTRDKNGAVTIAVRVKPGSKLSSITGVSAEAVGVAIAAPPTDGEANMELIRYLAEVLDVKRSCISVNKGSRSRDKVMGLDSSLSPDQVLHRLRQAAASRARTFTRLDDGPSSTSPT